MCSLIFHLYKYDWEQKFNNKDKDNKANKNRGDEHLILNKCQGCVTYFKYIVPLYSIKYIVPLYYYLHNERLLLSFQSH